MVYLITFQLHLHPLQKEQLRFLQKDHLPYQQLPWMNGVLIQMALLLRNYLLQSQILKG